MGDEEGTGNPVIGDREVSHMKQHLKRQAASNGLDVASCNNNADGRSRYSKCYKRRKRAMSSSGMKCMENGIGSAEAAGKSADQIAKELPSHLHGNHSALYGTNEVSPIQLRSFRAKTGCTSNGTQAAVMDEMNAKPHEFLDNSFLRVWQSKNFTSLCTQLFENFQGVNADNLFRLKLIDKRMKEGIYTHSPTLFSADIQQLCWKLQIVGAELMSLAKSLADISSSYSKQFEGAVNCASAAGKDELGTRESETHGKPVQTESCVYGVSTCRTCGNKADGRDCLVCDACEDMNHLSCIKPSLKQIPSKSWFCATCEGARPHVNCGLCEVLTTSIVTNYQQPGVEINPTDGQTVTESEEIMNDSTADGVQVLQRNEKLRNCKLCRNGVKNGNCLVCEHPFCPAKYYHGRCLTPRQRCRYGPKWYCPSCLCRSCCVDKDDDKIVLCDSCDHAYHIYCVKPILDSIPEGKWFCQSCNLKIQEIQMAKSAYETKKHEEIKRKREGAKMVNENEGKKACGEAMCVKNKDGVKMLAIAALKCEVGS